MYYPYMTIGNDFEVTHTGVFPDGTVQVHFEKPHRKLGFKVLNIELPTFRILSNEGFVDKRELDWIIQYCLDNQSLIMEYAKIGGVANA